MELSQKAKSGIFLGIIFAIVLFLVIFVSVSLHVDPVEEFLKKDPVAKCLLVIHDDEKNVISTDVFFYYPVTKKTAIVNIVGNTGAIYESINSVNRIDYVYKTKGVDVYCDEIEKLIDKQIPFTIEISLNQLVKITDMLGGLKVFIPTAIDYMDDDGNRFLLPNGSIVLDGDKLVTFVNYILPEESEEKRNERRREVVRALLTSLHDNRNTILDKKNFKYYRKNIKTNLDNESFYKVIYNFSQVESDRVSPILITGTSRTVDFEDGTRQVLLFPLRDGQYLKDVVNRTVNSLVNSDDESSSQVYVLEILNGTSQQGLARNTSLILQGAGYEVLEAGNADKHDYEHTMIIDHIGNETAVKSLGDFINCKYIVEEEVKPLDAAVDNVAKADFTIILGRDFDGYLVHGGYTGPKDLTEEEK